MKSPERGFPPSKDPLDRYTEETVHAALAHLPDPNFLAFSHDVPAVPIQKFADAAGLAQLGPAHLSIHERYGPWIALRAIAVFPILFDQATPDPAASPCDGCPAPCKPFLQRAIKMSRSVSPPSAFEAPVGYDEVSLPQRPWLALRDSCPIGRVHRYEPAQLRYHYDKRLD